MQLTLIAFKIVNIYLVNNCHEVLENRKQCRQVKLTSCRVQVQFTFNDNTHKYLVYLFQARIQKIFSWGGGVQIPRRVLKENFNMAKINNLAISPLWIIPYMTPWKNINVTTIFPIMESKQNQVTPNMS